MLIKNLQAKLHQAQLEISRLTAQLEVAQENLHASEGGCAGPQDSSGVAVMHRHVPMFVGQA